MKIISISDGVFLKEGISFRFTQILWKRFPKEK